MSRHPKISRVARDIQRTYSLDYAKQAKPISLALNELGLIDELPRHAVEHAAEIARKNKATFTTAAARAALLAGVREHKMTSTVIWPSGQQVHIAPSPLQQADQIAPLGQQVTQLASPLGQKATQAMQQPLTAKIETIFNVTGATILRKITNNDGTLIGIDVTCPPSMFNRADWEEFARRRLVQDLGPDWKLWLNPATDLIELREHGLPSMVRAAGVLTGPRSRSTSPVRANRTLEEAAATYTDMAIPYAVAADHEFAVWHPAQQPHLIAFGATGTGKSTLLSTLIAGSTIHGAETHVIDLKGLDLIGFRGYPNVVTVATEPYEAVALIDHLYREMRARYNHARSNRNAAQTMHPIVLVIDDYRALQLQLASFWRDHRPTTDTTPPTCPSQDKLASLLRLARATRVHIAALAHSPAPMVITAEDRDNFTHRITLGNLTAADWKEIWGDPPTDGGRRLSQVRGRGTYRGRGGEPADMQCLYTPDPASKDPADLDDLAKLRPPHILHPRRLFTIPTTDPRQAHEGDFAAYERLALVLAAEHPELDPTSPEYTPPPWLGDAPDEPHQDPDHPLT